MHISEGVLSGPVLAAGWVLAAGGTWLGVKRLDHERIMTVAMLAAAFFVASLIHFPVGPTSVHLVLSGLLGIVLGWAAFPAILVGLLLQAVFFQFGGFTTLGITTFNLAAPAVLCHFVFRGMVLGGGKPRAVAAFLAGAVPIALSGLLVAASLALTDEGFLATAGTLFAVHLPVMGIEGVVTVFAVSFLAKVQPEILNLPQQPTVGV
ncbi:cobalt transporter CbiM [Oceanidesulfovibrio indonesiensis]|uniref:Cobalt transporter CbiM n=1 Tax=Oceanidesulfovibrio indonesiensis TaxID=54767 RepID=A0A7M3MD23_9BACT|nr:cobalt transporter CbiM [Oceanidesulfovibrio indonesiensis]TVM15993.1 cobalt transporter CbiM [Oceanidesulfovibrio indonesiensis]